MHANMAAKVATGPAKRSMAPRISSTFMNRATSAQWAGLWYGLFRDVLSSTSCVRQHQGHEASSRRLWQCAKQLDFHDKRTYTNYFCQQTNDIKEDQANLQCSHGG